MNFIIKEKFLPETILPFSITKGSINVRKNKAAKQLKKFSNEYNRTFKDKNSTIEDVSKILDDILFPNKINYSIMKENIENFDGRQGTKSHLYCNKKDEITITHIEHSFYLPIENKNEISNKYVLFHEIRHFFDNLFNPKYMLMRYNDTLNHSYSIDDYEKLHNIFLVDLNKPQNKKKFHKKANELLKKIPNKVAIDLLQNIRYSLQSEINAYKDEIRFYIKDRKFKKAFENIMFLIKNCKFEMKLRFANQKLIELINAERKSLRNNRHN